MTYWFAVMVAVLSSGDLMISAHFPESYEFNSKERCERFAKLKSSELQTEIGTKNGIILWKCEEVSFEQIAKALPSR